MYFKIELFKKKNPHKTVIRNDIIHSIGDMQSYSISLYGMVGIVHVCFTLEVIELR